MMDDSTNIEPPKILPEIEEDTRRLEFNMGSDYQTGVLLRTLAATKPGGRLLELGTGTGLATAWILDGMDRDSRLITVDLDPACLEVAKRYLGTDARVVFRQGDSADVMDSLRGSRFDLIFADAWAGKFWDFQKAVDLLNDGGIYVIDDLLPAPAWPPDHPPKVDALLERIQNHPALTSLRLSWSTGLVIAVKR
ncbi:MAG: class I SAM-dependent methyltransferase [Acidobacteriota bacterium]|nr:class I SAM-dependent methyltransferase [Acidobacteriota bacterium]